MCVCIRHKLLSTVFLRQNFTDHTHFCLKLNRETLQTRICAPSLGNFYQSKRHRNIGLLALSDLGEGGRVTFLSENLHNAQIGKSFKIHSSCMVFVLSCKSVRVEHFSNGKDGYRLLVKIHLNAISPKPVKQDRQLLEIRLHSKATKSYAIFKNLLKTAFLLLLETLKNLSGYLPFKTNKKSLDLVFPRSKCSDQHRLH